jgi:3,4-dihydroxy 2-butanone 4-phosphate synthase/GTP cyclohydrolase II
MALNTAIELIEDIRDGKIIILMDDENRENEGDLVMAASAVKAEDINFMARFGRGLICLTLTHEHCKTLNLPLMAGNSYSSQGTNFTVSIEAAKGVTTGISAADRALTIQKAVAKDAKPSDLVQPGHVFPLMAHPGGVLLRAGHTEAGCDLAKLAGLTPAAVIVEVLKDDGTMARRPDLEIFASEHGLKIGTIADLIQHRIENEKTVKRIAEYDMQTEYGDFRIVAYEDSIDNNLHLAMIKGEINPEEPTLVRVHMQNPIYDLTGSLREDIAWPINNVLRRIQSEGQGVAVILCNQFGSQELAEQLKLFCQGESQELGHMNQQNTKDQRTIGLGAQILSDLGVQKMRVLSAPKRFHAISGFGLEIVEYVT